MITSEAFKTLLTRWREDSGSTYRTWFLWEERLKNFRSIRRGLAAVAADNREEEVRAQLNRPAFQRVSDLQMRYLPYSELGKHRESIARFGEGLKAIHSISKALV